MSDEREQFATDGGWNEQKRHVLSELGRQGKSLEHLETQVDTMGTRLIEMKGSFDLALANLKFRQTVVGALTVILPAVAAVALYLIDRFSK